MILLDTNIVIPLLRRHHEDLPFAILTLLERTERPFYVSVISLWEMAIKHRSGKLPIAYREIEWPEICALLDLALLPFTAQHAVTDMQPWPETRDPFDRGLLSVCSVERLRLVTTDRKLRDHPLVWRA